MRRRDRGESRAIGLAPKPLALLAYLAVDSPSRFHRRDDLLVVFWPDQDEARGRAALSQLLYQLRRAAGRDAISTRGNEEVGVSSERVWCDAVEFENRVAVGERSAALELYRGPFLDSFHVSGATAFERWLDETRDRLRRAAVEATGKLVDEATRKGDPTAAERWLRRGLVVSPTDEATLRRLILLLESREEAAEALRVYESFAIRLAQEYDLAPSEATVELVERLRESRGPVAARPTGKVAEGSLPGPASEIPSGPDRRRTASERRRRTPLYRVVAALALVLLLGGVYFATRDPRAGLGPRAAAAEAAPGIAVLPFTVSGAGLDGWSEGMVTLLSTGLDGAGDLRAIDSRSVLARWDGIVPRGSPADRRLALEVAEAAGAEYAVLGSAAALGPQLRLVAEVYAVDDGSRLGAAQAEGSKDDVLSVVDDLARGTLGIIMQEGEADIPPIRLAALTTNSLPALKAFLEGEALYRRGAIEKAIAAYESAVEIDSTFALAWMRAGVASSWGSGGSPKGRLDDHAEHAMRHAGRLPERERLLVEAHYLQTRGWIRGLQVVRQVIRKYPDEAYGWFLLGEYLFHMANALATLDEAEEAFGKAIELDPTFAPYRFHWTILAFNDPPDSALAARRVRELVALDPDAARHSRLALELAFGDPARRPALLDSVFSLEPEEIVEIGFTLEHPRYWEISERLVKILAEKGETWESDLFWGNLLYRGRLADALRTDGGFESLPCELWEAREIGLPVPEETLEGRLALGPADTTPGRDAFCRGLYALDRGRRADFDRVLDMQRRALEKGRAAGDTADVRRFTFYSKGMEGYARWKDGDPAAALGLLEGPVREYNIAPYLTKFWVGRLHLELGRPREALPYLDTRHWLLSARDPHADYHAAVAFEAAGEPEKARQRYASLVEHWRDPDHSDLRALLHRARLALARLDGSGEARERIIVLPGTPDDDARETTER